MLFSVGDGSSPQPSPENLEDTHRVSDRSSDLNDSFDLRDARFSRDQCQSAEVKVYHFPSYKGLSDFALEVSRLSQTEPGPISIQFRDVDFIVTAQTPPEEVLSSFKRREFDAHAEAYQRNFVERFSGLYNLAREVLVDIARTYPEPLRVLDLGCGIGFTFDSIFTEAHLRGSYFGIDPSAKSIEVLGAKIKADLGIQVATRVASATEIINPTVSRGVLDELGGRPHIIVLNASFQHIVKSEAAKIGPFLRRLHHLLAPGGTIMFGNYFHHSEQDYKAFCEAYERVSHHEPSKPTELFPPALMKNLLEWVGFKSVTFCEVWASEEFPIRAYVMTARKKGK